ncbi:hypothetical protein Hte_003859 [Hypoxylon texense]
MATENIQTAVKVRELGNKLYQKGRFSDAVKAYNKAVDLAPGDPTPLSNLSAVNFEAGKYAECVDFTDKALGLLKPDPETDTIRHRLLVRQAKAFLYQSSLDKAEKLLDHVKPGRDHESLRSSLSGLKEFDAFSSQPKLLRESLLQLPRLRPCLQNEPEYFSVSHDNAESVYTAALAQSAAKDPVLSIMFCGIGDARNLFQTLIQYDSSPTGAQKLHITMLDIKPAVIARDLIFFSLIHEATVNVESQDTIWLTLAYLFCTQLIPPFAWGKLQETIIRLLDSLEEGQQPFSFAYIPAPKVDEIVRFLKSWQRGPATAFETSQIRGAVAQQLAEEDQFMREAASRFMGPGKRETAYPECESDHNVFDEFSVLFPPTDVLPTLEPELSTLAADLESGVQGTYSRICDYLDKHWKVNATLIDVDFEAVSNELPHVGHDPFFTIKSLDKPSPALSATERTSKYYVLNYAVKFFARVSFSILTLKDRMTIEILVGDMMDVLERLRYGHLDRYPQGRLAGDQEDTEWPRKYHIIHASNIPDYIGGSLMNFLYAAPILKEGDGTGVTSCVLRNMSRWVSIDHFNAEHLIMHDGAAIQRHFLVKPVRNFAFDMIMSMMPKMSKMPKVPKMPPLFPMSFYHRWEKCLNKASPLEQLMPQPSLSKWLFAHFLKICLPFPRSLPRPEKDQLVFAPNNMTVFMRLLVQMAEAGYPGHWLSSIITSLSSGSITTEARAPRKSVLDCAAVDVVYPSRKMNTKPWVAEFTTLVTMWRGVLPFTVVAPSGILPSPEIITEYSITIPLHRCPNADVPHFTLVFWNDGKYDEPPELLRKILLDEEEGDTTTSARKIRSDGILMLGTFEWAMRGFMATFWLRSDVMDMMLREDWKVCLWRVDTWVRVTSGLSMKNTLQRRRTWKECVASA